MRNSVRLLLIIPILFSSSLAIAAEIDPNSPTQQPQPGWTVWRPKSEVSAAGFSAGFSNLELGGFLDFEYACSQALGTPQEKTPYWFRLTNSINQIGTGTAEFGCWQAGQFVNTMTSTAINAQLESVTCLRVRVPTGEDLRIRAEPGLNAKIIGSVRNGATVKPTSFPASITEADDRNWVEIAAPRSGWISNDRPESSGNLTLCK